MCNNLRHLVGTSVGWLHEAAMLRSTAITQPSVSPRTAGSVPPAEICVSVCLESGTPIPARLVELAWLDLMIIADRPLRYGTPVQLALFSDLVTAFTQNRGIVHWCRPSQHGWQIGIFLTQPLPDRLTEREWSDLRSGLRYECNWKARIQWGGDGPLEPVWFCNYSIKGICLLIPHLVPQGTKFTLFGSAGAKDQPVLNGEVQWIRQNPDGVQIGCRIQGQYGRDLPRMFGNLDAVHFASEKDPSAVHLSESIETQNCELSASEQFLAVGAAYDSSPSTSFP